jgi:hypothetical protein
VQLFQRGFFRQGCGCSLVHSALCRHSSDCDRIDSVVPSSYRLILVTEGIRGSGLSLRSVFLDSVVELYTEDDFRQLVVAVKATPAFLGGLGELKDHGESAVLFERHPLERTVLILGRTWTTHLKKEGTSLIHNFPAARASATRFFSPLFSDVVRPAAISRRCAIFLIDKPNAYLLRPIQTTIPFRANQRTMQSSVPNSLHNSSAGTPSPSSLAIA